MQYNAKDIVKSFRGAKIAIQRVFLGFFILFDSKTSGRAETISKLSAKGSDNIFMGKAIFVLDHESFFTLYKVEIKYQSDRNYNLRKSN